jgi:hypothetical protein
MMKPPMASIMTRARSALGTGLLSLALVSLSLTGCGGEIDGEMDGVEVERSAVLTSNALSLNALSLNALSLNALSLNALSLNALSLNALSLNALALNGLREPLGRELLKYIVSCALDDDQGFSMKIDGTRYHFPGSLGLASEWGRSWGSCDGECQRWVSACVLARVDYAGVPRPISLRGDHRKLKPEGGELRDYRDREAAYYGNIFNRDRPMYMCLSPGKTGNERVCGDSLENCDPIQVVGSCDDACADEGKHRSFEDCSDKGRAGRGRTYHESITVFLPK